MNGHAAHYSIAFKLSCVTTIGGLDNKPGVFQRIPLETKHKIFPTANMGKKTKFLNPLLFNVSTLVTLLGVSISACEHLCAPLQQVYACTLISFLYFFFACEFPLSPAFNAKPPRYRRQEIICGAISYNLFLFFLHLQNVLLDGVGHPERASATFNHMSMGLKIQQQFTFPAHARSTGQH